MRMKPLDCAEIRNGFTAGRVPAGPEVDAHLRDCPSCRELFEKGAQLGRRLAVGVSPELELGELFASVQRSVKEEVGFRARVRALPSGVRAGGLVAAAAALLAFELGSHRRADFGRLSPQIFWAVVLLLGAAVAFGARRLMRGATAPLGAAAREGGVAGALLVLPAVAVLLVPLGAGAPAAASEWGNPLGCFSYGAAMVAPFLALYWLFERRDAVPPTALVSAGALAGVAGNLLLHAHCGSVHPGHLLLGHASIGGGLALALALGASWWLRRGAR
jgi:hypothetical protein